MAGRAQARRVFLSEAMLREVLDTQRRVFGADHPHTLATRYHLAETMVRQGRRDAAEAPLRDLLETQRRVLGDRHAATRDTERLLGDGRPRP